MLKRLIAPFSKLLMRGCVSRKKSGRLGLRPTVRANVLEQQVRPYPQVRRFRSIKSPVLVQGI
jgi:hypothetical protein